MVRRPTGGRALLHDREITYSVTAPLAADESIAAAYRRINALLVEALKVLGVAAIVAKPAARSAALPGVTPCFAEPVAGELVVGDRKLVGSAQWRDGGALLQHGSVLVDDDQHRIPTFMRVSVPTPPTPATLWEVLARRPAPRELAEALFAAVRTLEDPNVAWLELDAATSACASALVERHRDAAWIWRR